MHGENDDYHISFDSFIDAKRKYAGFELSEKREPGKVHFTTIRKFKGLEAEAILVVDQTAGRRRRRNGRRACCRNEWHETGDSGDGTTWNTGSL